MGPCWRKSVTRGLYHHSEIIQSHPISSSFSPHPTPTLCVSVRACVRACVCTLTHLIFVPPCEDVSSQLAAPAALPSFFPTMLDSNPLILSAQVHASLLVMASDYSSRKDLILLHSKVSKRTPSCALTSLARTAGNLETDGMIVYTLFPF